MSEFRVDPKTYPMPDTGELYVTALRDIAKVLEGIDYEDMTKAEGQIAKILNRLVPYK